VFVKARKSPSGARFVFVRNLSGEKAKVKLSTGQEISLAQPDMQILALEASGQVVDSTGLDVDRSEPIRPTLSLPALGSWSFLLYSEPVLPKTPDASWKEIAPGRPMDIDSLEFYYGFVWYRGHYSGALKSFKLDARHCWAAYLDGEQIAFYDNFRNKMGNVGDMADTVTVRVPERLQGPGEHVLAILVESAGHNKGFMPDFDLPRGIVKIDTGGVKVSWKARGGLLPGEAGMTPVLPAAILKELSGETVSLPHQIEAKPSGLGLYSTNFNLSLPGSTTPVGLRINHAPEKALIYLNGAIIGRYWEKVGPQKVFYLMPPFINAQGANHLLLAVWPWGQKLALDPVSLEVYP